MSHEKILQEHVKNAQNTIIIGVGLKHVQNGIRVHVNGVHGLRLNSRVTSS